MGKDFIVKPKCLAKVNNEVLLKRHIRILSSCGVKNIIVVIGKKGDCWNKKSITEIKTIHNQLVYNNKNKVTNNSYSLLLGLNKLSNNHTIVIDGDLFYSKSFIQKLLNYNKDSYIVTKISQDRITNHNKVSIKGNLVKKIDRKISLKFPWLNYLGVICINKNSLGTFKKVLEKNIYLKSELSAPLNEIISNNKIYNYTLLDYCININNNFDLTDAENWSKKNEK